DVREPVLDQPSLELVEPSARVDDLEERPPADDRRVEGPVERDLLLEIVRDVCGAPAELDDVDERAGSVEEALDVADVEPLVDHVREALDPGLARPGGQVEEAVVEAVRAWQRSPPIACAPWPGRRGTGSGRARRCRP